MKLHLGLESHQEITEHEFKYFSDMLDFIIDVTKDKYVYVFAFDGSEHGVQQEMVIVQEKYYLTRLLSGYALHILGLDLNYENFYLQEYPSFEEAYKVALDMQETSPLCYNKE